ncbi:MAG: hypothetical protein AAF517_02635 [Planctomycetota bacterium]
MRSFSFVCLLVTLPSSSQVGAGERLTCDKLLSNCFPGALSVVFDESQSSTWDPGELTFDPDACACLEIAERERPEDCGDQHDNDRDGLVDCADPDCADHPACSRLACDPGDPRNAGCRIVNVSVVLDTPSDDVGGWAFSLAHDEDVLQLVTPSLRDTDTQRAFCEPAFNVTRIVDGGLISAIILCFPFPTDLSPGESTLLRASYILKKTPNPTTRIRFPPEGLAVDGSPPTTMHFELDGQALLPDRIVDGCLGKCDEIRSEICGNGIDDNSNGLADCDDPACLRVCSEEPFIRGDADGNGSINVSDAIVILRELFSGEPPRFNCLSARDSNANGQIELTDGIRVLWFLFDPLRPGAIRPPNEACGTVPPGSRASCREASPACAQ